MKQIPAVSYNSKAQGEGVISTASEFKGKNGCVVLAESENESKGHGSASSKVTKILLENFLRRPSLNDEAMSHLANFANDGIFAMQSPQYRTSCSAGALFFHKDSYRYLGFGTVRAYHFVDGQIIHAYPETPVESLGSRQHIDSISQPAAKFGKGENSFLLCSANFASAITPDELEESLAEATTAEHWVTLLRNLFESRSSEEYALTVMFMPKKKERPSKVKTVIIILVILALLVGGFLGMGALRRGKGPGPEGEGMPGMPGMPGPGGPGMPGMPTEPPAVTEVVEAAPTDIPEM